MSIKNSVCAMIGRYGSSVKISRGSENITTRAFVEPIRYKNKIYIGGRQHPLGTYHNEKYLYIGMPENALVQDESVIESCGAKYIVKRCETYTVSDIPIYVWAILTRYGERLEDEYDSDSYN